ncbi:histidine kinase N-terminal 7TM domain-containing protein [Salinigranum sp.]|uniref:histidine kinase N-terminal 7TM domain-containing protein n=1 Tax=Salinigranum sp. TaxID=1966351 RepID=UPI003564C0B1
MMVEVAYAGALFGTGVVSAVTAIVVLGRVRSYTQQVPLTFAAAALSASVWATGYGFYLLATTTTGRVFWSQILWFGAASLATLWFAFVLSYTRYEDFLTPWTAALLAVEPGVVIGLVMTSNQHGLLGSSGVVTVGALPTLSTTGEPLLVFHGVYTGVVVAAGFACLVAQFRRSRRLYRRQVAVVLAASAVPVAASLLGAAVLRSGVDVTPVSFGLSSVAVLVGFYRYQLFDLTPIARDVVVGELRDGVVVVDDCGRIVEANPRARQIFGVEDDALVGRALADVPDHGPALERIVDDTMAREEFVVDGSDGDRFFEATASRFDGQGAHERGHLVVLRDVTEQRRTEEEFRALIENSRDLITVVSADGTRTYCAPSFERTLGHDPDEAVGRDVFELVHPEDRPEVRETFERLLGEERGAQERAEYRVRHADGSWRTFEAVAVNLVDDPTVQGVVVNARDVTARRRYEQRLRVLNRVLRHDLRNEVNVIQGHADLLLDRKVTAEAKEHARIIRKKAKTLVDLGRQMRTIDYTLHDTDGVERPLEITEAIHDRLDAIQEEFPGAIVTRDLPDEQWVLADDLVPSAIENLIDNAIEHNDRVVPQITVTVDHVTVDGVDYVEVSVVDNGPGIPEAERRVFDDGIETPLSHGSGLGLWLTEWIVTQSNGRLCFEENEPRGTVVRIRLHETASMPTEDPEMQTASTD